MENLTIGQLAKKVNVNTETIRYYERRGFIPKPPRPESGYRQYANDDVRRVKFIKRAQALGFTLKEISEILSLRVKPGVTCHDVKIRIEAKIKDVGQKIADLEAMKKALRQMAGKCTGEGPIGNCPFLEELKSNTDS